MKANYNRNKSTYYTADC